LFAQPASHRTNPPDSLGVADRTVVAEFVAIFLLGQLSAAKRGR